MYMLAITLLYLLSVEVRSIYCEHGARKKALRNQQEKAHRDLNAIRLLLLKEAKRSRQLYDHNTRIKTANKEMKARIQRLQEELETTRTSRLHKRDREQKNALKRQIQEETSEEDRAYTQKLLKQIADLRTQLQAANGRYAQTRKNWSSMMKGSRIQT